MSQMMVTKNPQNVHRKYFWAILVTFISDIKIDVNMCEPHYVYLFFFVNILHSPDVWLFDIWHLFDNLTSFWQLDIFLTFWVQIAHGPHCPYPCIPLPMYPIAHVTHCWCGPYPLYPIPPVPLLPMCPIPLYPIPPVPPLPIGPMAYAPCTPYPLYTIAPSFWHFDTFNLNHLSPHRAIFVVLTALIKSHPISSPAAVIFERKNNECISPLYSKKHVFLMHDILYTSHIKGPCKLKLFIFNIVFL